MFYTYLWLREDGTPYYVGKGIGGRAYRKHRVGSAPPLGRIVFYIAKDEADAFEMEMALIWYYGRKDLSLGVLRNLTDGGENPPNPKGKKQTPEHIVNQQLSRAEGKGFVPTEETRKKMSVSRKGKPSGTKGIPSAKKGTKLSEETVKRMCIAAKKRCEIPMSDQQKLKISETLKRKGIKPTLEARSLGGIASRIARH